MPSGVETKKEEKPTVRLTSRQDKKRAREKEMTEEEKEKAAEAAEERKARAAKAAKASQAARAARAVPPEDAAHRARASLSAELSARSLVDLQLDKVELVSRIEELKKHDQVNTPGYRDAEERLRALVEVEANKAGRTAAYAASSAGGGSSSPSAYLPADLSVVPLKDLKEAVLKKQLEIEELKEHGQVETPPYRDAVKLLLALRKETKERLDAKTQAKKKQAKTKAEAALVERRDLAIANPDNYKSYLKGNEDLKWWEREGRERAEAARDEERRAAHSQGAEDPSAAPRDNQWQPLEWRPPRDVATEDM